MPAETYIAVITGPIAGLVIGVLSAAIVLIVVYCLLARSSARLRYDEALLRELMENLREGVWMLDAESLSVIYISPCYARLLGRDPGEVDGPGAASGAVHPADHERVAEAYARLRDTGQLTEEYRVLLPDGSTRWVRDRAIRVTAAPRSRRAGHRRRTHIAGISYDVTERRDTEDALRESQRAMTTLLSNLPGMAYRCVNDRQWTMQFISEGCAELTGYPPEDYIGNRCRSFADVIHADDRERVWQEVQKELQRRRPFEIMYRIITASGDTKCICEMGRGVFDESGQLLAIEGFMADDTERQRAEHALRESEQRYRNLVEQAPVAIVIHRDERFVFANPAAVQMLAAKSVDELIGRPIWDIIHPDYVDIVRRRVRTLYQRAGSVPVIEEQFYRLDGEVIDVEVIASTVAFEGRPASQAMFTDITERKLQEAEHAKLEGELRQSQKMEAIGQLAGGIAHDFNNILTAIIGHLGLAEDAIAKVLPHEHAGVHELHEVERAANRAAGLTRQLLTFSRKDVAQPEILDLNQIIIQMRGMLRRLIRESIELELRLAPDLRRVRADANQLEQVVLNLVVNARDAMPGGGRLTVETRNVVLDAGYVSTQPDARPGPHLVLAVSDTGTGMDQTTVERIFEPFFTTKDIGQGTGLGLATVHGIVRQSGGHITVYSEPGVGTTFKICLPAAAGAASRAPAEPEPVEAKPLGQGETILVCEDDASVRQLTTKMLRSAGYKVIVASNGAAALKIAGEHPGPIDLLVTDVIMPEMNGRQLARALASNRPDMRTLYISGYTSDVIAHHGVVDADIEFLEKPFGQADLLKRVREVLNGARLKGTTSEAGHT
jgi:PAS domain S-box-containing protein